MKQFNNTDNKRENRRAMRIFIPILLAGMVFGGCAGFLLTWLHNSPEATGSLQLWGNRILQACAPYAILVLTVLLMGGAYLFYGRAKRRFSQWNGEEETVIEQVENDLSKGMLLTQINQIVSFFFFAAAFYVMPTSLLSLLPLASFMLALFLIMLFQKQAVDFLKTINPEKHGSVFDFNFQKKWVESCDEAQQLLIYKAAYKGYLAGLYTCLALWLICVLANIAFDVGLLPVACVTLIWLVITIVYHVESYRLQKRIPPVSI